MEADPALHALLALRADWLQMREMWKDNTNQPAREMKTTPIELKQFFNDKAFWPDDVWYEEVEFRIDGAILSDDADVTELPESTVVDVKGGYVCDTKSETAKSFVSYLSRWRKGKNSEFLTLEIPKGRSSDIKKLVSDYLKNPTPQHGDDT